YTDSSGGAVTHSAALGPFAIHATQGPAGTLKVGAVGDIATVAAAGSAWVVTVLQPVELSAATLEATAGSYRVTAPDGSRLTVSLSAPGGTSSATLVIDTDGDGKDDGSLSIPWEFVF
ncbi:MAG: hypothetical protein Q7S90_09645, partial [Rubrivivax sp.]|nr:hypothetical protein [Rubrivivax sp.]